MKNVDPAVVSSFGDEWTRFDYVGVPARQLATAFEQYFALFPWEALPKDSVGFDLGCGTGRWARFVAPRVGSLHCVEPSAAMIAAKRNLVEFKNCVFHACDLDSFDVPAGTMDFGYSLGVLHHLPDTRAAIAQCAKMLKPGAPLLLYLYYALDNRPWWYRRLWRISDLGRRVVSSRPAWQRNLAADAIAYSVYMPLARTARLAERLGCQVDGFPLAAYRDKSAYVIRTDALDRFGTRLEHRFTREQVVTMMTDAGLRGVRVSDAPPFWTAVGVRDSV